MRVKIDRKIFMYGVHFNKIYNKTNDKKKVFEIIVFRKIYVRGNNLTGSIYIHIFIYLFMIIHFIARCGFI